MAVRSTTSEYQPAPPILRLTTKTGDFNNVFVARTTNTGGVKANVCVPPLPGSTRMLALRLALR